MKTTMDTRKALAASFLADKAAAMVKGDYVELRKLMEPTDDILSGHHDLPAEYEAFSDDQLLAELSA